MVLELLRRERRAVLVHLYVLFRDRTAASHVLDCDRSRPSAFHSALFLHLAQSLVILLGFFTCRIGLNLSHFVEHVFDLVHVELPMHFFSSFCWLLLCFLCLLGLHACVLLLVLLEKLFHFGFVLGLLLFRYLVTFHMVPIVG